MHILPISLPPTLTPSSASRSSAGRYLSPAHAYEFANNVLFAEWSGTWLNTSITLAWTKCRGFDPNDPRAAHTYLEAAIDCVRDLLRRRGVAMVYAWVKEAAPTARSGIHHHLLPHLPPSDYDELLERLRRTARGSA